MQVRNAILVLANRRAPKPADRHRRQPYGNQHQGRNSIDTGKWRDIQITYWEDKDVFRYTVRRATALTYGQITEATISLMAARARQIEFHASRAVPATAYTYDDDDNVADLPDLPGEPGVAGPSRRTRSWMIANPRATLTTPSRIATMMSS